MAETTLHVKLSEEISNELKALSQQIKDAQLVLTEERIRQIIREELDMWEQRQIQRARFGDRFERK